MAFIFVQALVAWFYSHLLEYGLHRVLHDYKRFPQFFKHHFGQHHKVSRNNEMYDKNYETFSDASYFEFKSVLLILVLHSPLILIFPYAYATLFFCAINYYYMHRKAHINVEWGRKKIPWHYDHHMNKDQHFNWGVRSDIIDRLFGTRQIDEIRPHSNKRSKHRKVGEMV
tara:strand:+ start:1741 stop:2250 length:510 start_codon:yes stop_codon:yes gene_type:complete